MTCRYLARGAAPLLLAFSLSLPSQTWGQVSQDEFNDLKKMVERLNQKMEKMEQTHARDQQLHEEDQTQIRQLQQKLGEIQTPAANTNTANLAREASAAAQAQSTAPVAPVTPPATHNFTLAGDAEVIFGQIQGRHPGFALADYAPIFLYRAGDRTLFEAGFDFLLSDGIGTVANANAGSAFTFDLSFAQIDYALNDYVTLVAGNMLLPLGTYSERSAGWLNKFPDNPLPRGLVPASGLGAQLRGAIPIGESGQMVTYSLYGVNGPSATDNTGSFASLDLAGNVGILSNSHYGGATTFDSLGNIHEDPTVGGRIGWFIPWKPHWDLELGLSGQSGEWNDLGNNYTALVIDAAAHLTPYFEAKGEYLRTWIGSADLGTVRPDGWWIQAGYKLPGLGLQLPVINNLELTARYDTSRDMLGVPDAQTSRYSVGLVYYFSNTLLAEFDYEWLHSSGSIAGIVPKDELLFQISYGF